MRGEIEVTASDSHWQQPPGCLSHADVLSAVEAAEACTAAVLPPAHHRRYGTLDASHHLYHALCNPGNVKIAAKAVKTRASDYVYERHMTWEKIKADTDILGQLQDTVRLRSSCRSG